MCRGNRARGLVSSTSRFPHTTAPTSTCSPLPPACVMQHPAEVDQPGGRHAQGATGVHTGTARGGCADQPEAGHLGPGSHSQVQERCGVEQGDPAPGALLACAGGAGGPPLLGPLLLTDLFAPHPGRVSRVSFSRVAAPAVAGRRDAAGGETLAGGAGESPRGSGDASGSTSGESGAPPEGVAEEAASREGDPLAGAPEGEQDGDGVGAPAEGKGSSSSNAALRALTTASKKLSLGGSNSGSLLSVRPEERIRMVEEVYALEVDDLKHVGRRRRAAARVTGCCPPSACGTASRLCLGRRSGSHW